MEPRRGFDLNAESEKRFSSQVGFVPLRNGSLCSSVKTKPTAIMQCAIDLFHCCD